MHTLFFMVSCGLVAWVGLRFALRVLVGLLERPRFFGGIVVCSVAALTLMPPNVLARGSAFADSLFAAPSAPVAMIDDLSDIVREENATATTSESVSDEEMAEWYGHERGRVDRTWARVLERLGTFLGGEETRLVVVESPAEAGDAV